jgi:hypothetical protein
MKEFTELNRRFIKAFNKDNPEESAFQSYLVADLMGIGESLGWGDVLQSPISVILGEPGSGKSTELLQQSDKLIADSRNAFFIRLDRLVSEPFMSVIGERERNNFTDWKTSVRTAHFFFDSVDESKLRRSDDFLTALSRIRDVFTDQDLIRAHLIFSSRISEWRPVTDMQALKRLFLVTAQTEKIEKRQKSGDLDLLEKDDEGYEAKPKKNNNGEETDLVVVQILPLDADRVRLYARWLGLTDTDDFISAIDSHHAWEFARRPLDVHSLIEFWRTHGRLGSLTELIEHSLSVSLRETERRESLDPLTPITARRGAEALAATALLCRNLNFKIPDEAFVSVDTSVIDSTSCLPGTWSPVARRALLTRTLFDGATYGCIRFHHRRTMEYLAASWLSERIRDGCPQDRLDELIFVRHQGEFILRPSMAPVAAWLANGGEPHNELMRERLLQSGPGIHLKYGDPERLPVEYKKLILSALVARYADRRRVWLDTDPEALTRLADPALSPDILEIIRNRSIAGGLRADMLLLVRHGRLTDCLEAALKIFADPAEEEDIKHYAVAAIRDCGDVALRRRLADIVGTQPAIPSGLTALLCETLCPEIIDASGLADLLRKTERSSGHSFDLPWVLKGQMNKLAPNAAGPFLVFFVELLGTEPYLEDGRDRRISQRFHWLCDVLPSLLIKFLEKNHLDAHEALLAANCIRIIDDDRTYGGHIDVAKEAKQISEAVRRHPTVRSEYFWQGVERFRSAHQKDPD